VEVISHQKKEETEDQKEEAKGKGEVRRETGGKGEGSYRDCHTVTVQGVDLLDHTT
jgi:hypothetical protein